MDYLVALPILAFAPTGSEAVRTRETLEDVSQCVFLVPNLLTPEECDSVVVGADGLGMSSVDWEYAKNYRSCLRLTCSSPTLAQAIELRVKGLFGRRELEKVTPCGIGTEGEWAFPPQACAINSCMRISKYSQGNFFAKHRDNGFVFSDDFRSIYTVVIYLNDQFEGGQTIFYPQKDKQVRVQPRKGLGIIFSHECLHEGLVVASGDKIVLRTDVMFQRIEELRLLSYRDDPRYQEAARLYRESITLQKQGKPAESTTAFRQALEVHAALSCWRDEERARKRQDRAVTSVLSKDVWLLIALKLSLAECARLFVVNSHFLYFLRRASPLWIQRYQKKWPTECLRPSIVTSSSRVVRPSTQESLFFYHAFKARFLVDKKKFEAIWVDLSSNIGISRKGPFSARAAYACGHLWHSGEGMFNCTAGEELEANLYHEDYGMSEKVYSAKEEENKEKGSSLAVLMAQYHNWFGPSRKTKGVFPVQGFSPTAAAFIARYCVRREHGSFGEYFQDEKKGNKGKLPIIIAVLPHVAADTSSQDRFFADINWVVPLCPLIAMISMSEVLIHYYGESSCLCVMLSDTAITCSAVIRGEEDRESIMVQRFNHPLVSYPCPDIEEARKRATANLLSTLNLEAQFVVTSMTVLRERTKFSLAIIGGLVDDAVFAEVSRLLPQLRFLHPTDPWTRVSTVAITNLLANPSSKELFHGLTFQSR